VNTFDKPHGFARSIGAIGCLDAVLSEPDEAGSDLPCCVDSIFAITDYGRGITNAIKQVAPVIKEEPEEIVVITVYTFFF
jgi:hypothetical protein